MLAFSLAILSTSHPLGPNVPKVIDASHLSLWSKPTLIGCLPPTLWSWCCQRLHGPHAATWEAFVCHSQRLHSRGCHTSLFLSSSPSFGILHSPECPALTWSLFRRQALWALQASVLLPLSLFPQGFQSIPWVQPNTPGSRQQDTPL